MMSNGWQGSSFFAYTPNSVAESSNDASRSSTAPPPHISAPLLPSLSSPHSGLASTSRIPVSKFSVPLNGVIKKPRIDTRTAQEDDISRKTASRFAASLAADHIAVLYPDIDTPFADAIDVLNRLLPYHVFQQPWEDLDGCGRDGRVNVYGKGKGKAMGDRHVQNDVAETKFAIECFRRRKALQDRFRRARIKSGTRSAPDDQTIILAQSVLETERTEIAQLNSELRVARGDLDRIEREKRLSSMPPRPSYYSPHSIPSTQQHVYRPYPYAYAQPYNPSAQPASLLSSETLSTVPNSAVTGAIPVQLPVTSLGALASLGIVPVPAASLPPADQPQPPAVLKGSTNNGTMLSLEINVSLLQPAQMSGLATMLNSLMRAVPQAAALNSVVTSGDSNHKS